MTVDFPATLESRLNNAVEAFLAGLQKSVLESSLEDLSEFLEDLPRWERGFAYEGAAMGISLKDRAMFWRKPQWPKFLALQGRNYFHLLHIGFGWAMARQKVPPAQSLRSLDPLYGWLSMDGYGFYLGFFGDEGVNDFALLDIYSGYERHVIYQGYGRALWFLTRGSVPTIHSVIGEASAECRADLWSGIGLASVYAGALDEDGLRKLVRCSGKFRPALAQGAAFAAKARKLSGDLVESSEPHDWYGKRYFDLACQIICGVDAATAACITDDALDDLHNPGKMPLYQLWRLRIQDAFSSVTPDAAALEAAHFTP